MKITNQQLKQIIKEELLSEVERSWPATPTDLSRPVGETPSDIPTAYKFYRPTDKYNNPFFGKIADEEVKRIEDGVVSTKIYNANNGVIAAIDNNGKLYVALYKGGQLNDAIEALEAMGFRERANLSVPVFKTE